MTTTLDTKNWVSKPFTAQGINFTSRLDPNGSIYKIIVDRKVSDTMFMSMNEQAVTDLWSMYKDLNVVELLKKVNHGAKEALIELAV